MDFGFWALSVRVRSIAAWAFPVALRSTDQILIIINIYIIILYILLYYY